MDKRPIYVVDTNILVGYPNIIPSTNLEDCSKDPTINLNGAHLIIPTAVVRELSKFKEEYTTRGKVARMVLAKLRELITDEENLRIIGEGATDMISAPIDYVLERTYVLDEENDIILSLLPETTHVENGLPIQALVANNDMDGQIIVAAALTKYTDYGRENSVTLITNDNGLAVRAQACGIDTARYGYKHSDPYTGRRDMVVPKELFYEFYHNDKLPRVDFEDEFPDEPKLIANEFVIMSLEDPDDYPDECKDDNSFFYIGRYDVRADALVKLKYAMNFPVTPVNPGQAIYAEALMDPSISAVVCRGPAGCGKTYMATVYGYTACKEGDYIGVTVVPCEDSCNIGALPGDLEEKIDPSVQPLKNALRNYLLRNNKKIRKDLENYKKFGATDKISKHWRGQDDERNEGNCHVKERVKDQVDLIWKNWFDSIPIEHARGRDFSHEIAIYDEFQDQNRSQADTLIKRIGTDGKIVITGDIEQIHAPYLDRDNNGLVYASDQLSNNLMVAQVCFTEEEVVRHPLVKLIAERQNNHHSTI